MSSVKEFNYKLCFVGKESMLMDPEKEAKENFPHNPLLSKALAYCFLIISELVKHDITESKVVDVIRVGKPKTRAIAAPREPPSFLVTDEELLKVLINLFPFPAVDIVSKRKNELNKSCWVVEELNTATKFENKWGYEDGYLMMPIFVKKDNQIVYNIRDLNKEESTDEITPQHVVAALKFFNCIVRAKKSGIEHIIWKDPVYGGTKLQNENYDTMFALFVADKYLQLTREHYTDQNELQRLSLSIAFLEVLKKMTGAVDEVIIKKVETFSKDMLDYILVPFGHDTKYNYISNLNVDVNKEKSMLFDILYTIYVVGVPRNLVVSGYPNWDQLVEVAKLYGNMNITVWDTKKPSIFEEGVKISTKKEKLDSKKISAYDANTLFISGHLTNPFIKDFKGVSMIKTTPSMRYAYAFISCFANYGTPHNKLIIIPGQSKRVVGDDIKSYEVFVDKYYRDKNRRMYHRDTKESTGELSFDEAILQYLLTHKTTKRMTVTN